MLGHAGIRLTLYDLGAILNRASDATFSRRNIIKDFEATVIVPINEEHFIDEDFAAAKFFIPAVGPTATANPCSYRPDFLTFYSINLILSNPMPSAISLLLGAN